MKKFCNSLREHAQRIVGFEKKKMLLLTSKELKSHEDGKVCQMWKIFQKYSLQRFNGSKYDYHFIIKELANESKVPFECVGENSEIYKRFSVPIKRRL